MSNISSDTINRIKQISIIDIARHLGIVVKRNKSYCYTGHDKNTPSLSFDEKKSIYNCFGCEESGDSITLVRRVLKIGFKEACDWLANEFHITSSVFFGQSKYKKLIHNLKATRQNEQSEYEPNPEIYEWIIEQTSLSSTAREYLTGKRGFSNANIDSLSIRDVPSPNLLFNKLLKRWGQNALIKCGLAKLNDYNQLKCVWWDHIILFPFTNLNYRVDYLQARRFALNDPKYVNLIGVSPSIYHLDQLAYYNPGDQIFICEGIPDTITAIEKGLKAVGVLGVNGFKDEWVKYFVDFNVNVIPDTDKAGGVLVNRLRDAFKNVGRNIRVIELPKSIKDLNELFNKENNRI